jgi:hypothetical protein
MSITTKSNRQRADVALRTSYVHLTLKSRNKKVGGIPVSTSTAATCPDACPLKSKGCYATSGPLNLHWRNVSEGTAGGSWDTFTAQIAALPMGQPWRHNQAGDLPGDGDAIDAAKLSALVNANRGKLGWTYTHKPMDIARNRKAVADANANGFTINLSADTLAEADQLAALNIGPVVVVLDAPEGAKADTVTPEGRRVVTCPATYRDDVRCSDCLLCARANRETIVGFPAHGTYRKAAAAVARG